MKNLSKIALFSCLLTTPYACGSDKSSGSSAEGGAPSGSGQDTQAAQQGSQAADQASSSDGVGAGQSAASQMALEVANRLLDLNTLGSFATTVQVGSCTGQVTANATVSGETVSIAATDVFSDSNCTGDIKLAGSQNITITASLTDGNRTTAVTGDLNMTMATGEMVAIASLSAEVPYSYQLIATGTPTTGASDVNIIVALNEHRVGSKNGVVQFDHNITTPTASGVQVAVTYSGTTAQSHTIVGGEIDVHHNLAKFLAKHTYNNLQYDLSGTCACPQSGSITQLVTADSNVWMYTRAYAFTGCGEATVTTSGSTLAGTENGTASITWDSCTQ